jgi:hypothetical protein
MVDVSARDNDAVAQVGLRVLTGRHDVKRDRVLVVP